MIIKKPTFIQTLKPDKKKTTKELLHKLIALRKEELKIVEDNVISRIKESIYLSQAAIMGHRSIEEAFINNQNTTKMMMNIFKKQTGE